MASSKITDLTQITNPALTDIVALVDSPGGTPASRKCTLRNINPLDDYVLLADTGVLGDTGGGPSEQNANDGWRFRLVEWSEFPVLEFWGWAQFATDSAAFWVDFSVDSGASWTAGENKIAHVRRGRESDSSEIATSSSTDDLWNIHNDIGNASGEYAAFRLRIYNWSLNGVQTHAVSHLILQKPTGVAEHLTGAMKLDTGGDITDIALYGGSSQNADTGKIQVYGLRGFI